MRDDGAAARVGNAAPSAVAPITPSASRRDMGVMVFVCREYRESVNTVNVVTRAWLNVVIRDWFS
jgi:hypothetical protein